MQVSLMGNAVRIDESVLDDSEKMILALRSLCREYGYERYRMGKFEEYDLYAGHKDFLVSDAVITFTDTDRRLMALRPDVTLSVVKNLRDEPDALRKLCYNENVYRISGSSGAFREIMQAGAECVGRVDSECVAEVLLLSAKCLALCAPSSVLEVSNLDILRDFVHAAAGDRQAELLPLVSEKNLHGVSELCRRAGAREQDTEALLALLRLGGPLAEALPRLRALCAGRGQDARLDELELIASRLERGGAGERTVLDFSAVGNLSYYNGILFRGFAEGVPESVLSGGQYDGLMRKMGKRSGAIGFAVYLDRLEQLSRNRKGTVDGHA